MFQMGLYSNVVKQVRDEDFFKNFSSKLNLDLTFVSEQKSDRGVQRYTIDPINREQKFYGDRLIVTDGGVFAKQPWVTLSKIERVLFPKKKVRYFTENRFHKRDDGYYCLVKVKKGSYGFFQGSNLIFQRIGQKREGDNLLCLPKSKGRSAGETIPDEIRNLLEDFYYPTNRLAGYNFSWLSQH